MKMPKDVFLIGRKEGKNREGVETMNIILADMETEETLEFYCSSPEVIKFAKAQQKFEVVRAVLDCYSYGGKNNIKLHELQPATIATREKASK